MMNHLSPTSNCDINLVNQNLINNSTSGSNSNFQSPHTPVPTKWTPQSSKPPWILISRYNRPCKPNSKYANIHSILATKSHLIINTCL